MYGGGSYLHPIATPGRLSRPRGGVGGLGVSLLVIDFEQTAFPVRGFWKVECWAQQ